MPFHDKNNENFDLFYSLKKFVIIAIIPAHEKEDDELALLQTERYQFPFGKRGQQRTHRETN